MFNTHFLYMYYLRILTHAFCKFSNIYFNFSLKNSQFSCEIEISDFKCENILRKIYNIHSKLFMLCNIDSV